MNKIITSKVISVLLAVVMMAILPTIAYSADTPEMPYVSVNGVAVNDGNQSDVLGNGSCSFSYNNNDSVWELKLTNASLTKNIMLGHPARGGFGNFRVILNGANSINMNNMGSAIEGLCGGDIEITGDGSLTITTVNTSSGISMNSLSTYPNNGNLFLKGANITVNAQTMAFNVTKNINITNSSSVTATITEPYNAVISASKMVKVSDSKLNLTATSTAKSAVGIKSTSDDIELTNSNIEVHSTSNAINAYHNLTIMNTKLNAVSTTTTSIYANNDLTIGGTSEVTTKGYYRGLQAGHTLTVNNGKVDATSTNDIAVWALDSIALNAGEFHAKGAEGRAAIGVRITQADETAPTAKITLNQNYEEISGGIIDASDLYANGNNYSYWTSFIDKSDKNGLATNMSNALNDVTIRIKSANYSKVDSAIAKANNLKSENYKDFSAVTSAINAVVTGKDITEQTTVDSYATDIENAINSLQYKDADYSKVNQAIAKANKLNAKDYKNFSAVTSAINAVVTGKNITQQATVDGYAADIESAINSLEKKESTTQTKPSQSTTSSTSKKPVNNNETTSPKTGYASYVILSIMLVLTSAGGLTMLGISKKRKIK